MGIVNLALSYGISPLLVAFCRFALNFFSYCPCLWNLCLDHILISSWSNSFSDSRSSPNIEKRTHTLAKPSWYHKCPRLSSNFSDKHKNSAEAFNTSECTRHLNTYTSTTTWHLSDLLITLFTFKALLWSLLQCCTLFDVYLIAFKTRKSNTIAS